MSRTNRLSTTDLDFQIIGSRIFTIRDIQAMLDSDLAELYQVETKVLNQAVKRNIARFPQAFRFQLTTDELEALVANCDLFHRNPAKNQSRAIESSRSQIVTLNGTNRGFNYKYRPYAFTEQGVAMLSAVLRSDVAVQVSVAIMSAFVEMRSMLRSNAQLLRRIDVVEHKQSLTEEKVDALFDAMEAGKLPPKQGIFFDCQVFDAHAFVSGLVKSAKKSLVLIDNYIDESVLVLFSKRSKNVPLTLLTKNITHRLELDVQKFNEQYPPIALKAFAKAHDRFLIIDEKFVYHVGASLKDLGKKWFAFSKMDIAAIDVLKAAGEV